jgi:phosphohistidine phosphatase
MELYLLRHGIATDVGPKGSGDAGRPLTEEGIARMRDEAHGLQRLGLQLDVLLSSPLVRARQTAEIVGQVLNIEPQLTPALAPSCGLAQLRDLLGQHRGGQRVMIVGHEPDFSELAGALTGGSRVQFKKGGLARIDTIVLEQGAGVLVWLLAPRVLRMIGGA